MGVTSVEKSPARRDMFFTFAKEFLTFSHRSRSSSIPGLSILKKKALMNLTTNVMHVSQRTNK